METGTICCKLLATPAIAGALQATSEHFPDACNHILKMAVEENIHNAIKLHELCYAEIRNLFKFSAF